MCEGDLYNAIEDFFDDCEEEQYSLQLVGEDQSEPQLAIVDFQITQGAYSMSRAQCRRLGIYNEGMDKLPHHQFLMVT